MHRVQWLNADWTAGRGIGFYVWRLGGRTVVGHGGALLGYRTEIQIVPAEKVADIVMSNADDGQPLTYVEKLFQWLVPAVVAAAQPKAKPAAVQDEWQAYVGRYRNAWGDSQVMLYQGELVMVFPTDPDPLYGMVKFRPQGSVRSLSKPANVSATKANWRYLNWMKAAKSYDLSWATTTRIRWQVGSRLAIVRWQLCELFATS